MAARPYLPIDPGQAIKRIEQIYQQSGAKTILTCGGVSGSRKTGAIFLEKEYREYEKTGEISLPDNPYGTPIGCLLRGSTGTPKGVRISLTALENFCWMDVVHTGYCKMWSRNNSQSVTVFLFDLSVADLWPCFAAGATVWALKRKNSRI